jgi:pimeloyl-ACP methyl ester carboxylesterase
MSMKPPHLHKTPTAAVRAPNVFKLALEARAPFEFAAGIAALPLLANQRRGDGHPVIVYPGFMASDISTGPLRMLLGWLGYLPHGWHQGRNLNPSPEVFEQARAQIRAVYAQSGRKVSLVGWSLGGLYARELAKLEPDAVRSVVSLGSPFAGSMQATHARRLFDILNRGKVQAKIPLHRLHESPPVPTTSIYSRTDGIVAWQSSVQEAGHQTESIEVQSSHTGMGVNPLVLHALTDRLAQAEGQWKPFERSGLRRVVYPNSQRRLYAGKNKKVAP